MNDCLLRPKADPAFWCSLIVTLRHESGMSQRQVAALTGIPRNTVRNIETDESSPHVHNLERILAVFGLELDALKAN